jgi:hypothetical protein
MQYQAANKQPNCALRLKGPLPDASFDNRRFSSMRSILRQYMSEMKYDVGLTCNGREAIQKCEETKDFAIARVVEESDA